MHVHTYFLHVSPPQKMYPGLALTPKLSPHTNHDSGGPPGGPSRTSPPHEPRKGVYVGEKGVQVSSTTKSAEV